MKTIVSLIMLLIGLVMGGSILSAATALHIVPSAVVLLLSVSAFSVSQSGAVYTATVGVTDIKTAFGNYYINQGQNMDRLFQLIKQKTVLAGVGQPIKTNDSVWRASTSEIGNIVQRFQKQFTPKGTINFKPRKFDLYNMKIDLSLYPDEIKESWLGFLEGMDTAERAKWPLIRYMAEKEVLPQMQHDLEMKEHYLGVFSAGIAGVAGVTGQSMNGVRKLVQDGDVSDLALGTITKSNAFDKIEEAVEKIDPILTGEKMILLCSPTIATWYMRDKRNTHGGDTNYGDGKAYTIDGFPNVEFVTIPGMAGTEDIIITPKFNFKYLTRINGISTPKIEESKREVFMMMDFWQGFGFIFDEYIYYHEQGGSGSGA